ncbi:sugar uptake ABC transporter periplasmic solute-binding protein precursor [Gammaproteobacteria bacterium]|nr:sugar uptake ABC transporter periplasmic solute-binding protein precursor [Gammaproteobacteria bacterium]
MNMLNIIKTSLICSTMALVSAISAHAQTNTEVIGASLLTQQHPFYVALGNAMKDKAAAEGVTINISIANQDLNKQVSDIEDFITKKVSAIILSPVDSKGVKSVILKAQKAGIPVFTVDIAASGVEVSSHIATDNYSGGVLAGQLMGKVLDGKGEVAVITYPTIQSVIDRVEGFKKGIAQFPDIKIVAMQPGITRAEALVTSQNMLQANPNLAGIFGFGDDMALAAASAVKSAKKTTKVIGFDGMEEARKAVDNDPLFVGVITQHPEKMGELAVEAAIKTIKGESVEKNIPVIPGVYVKKD